MFTDKRWNYVIIFLTISCVIAAPLYFFYRQEIPAPLLNNLLTNNTNSTR